MEKGIPIESSSTATKLLEKRSKMYKIKGQFDRAKEEEREREEEFKEIDKRIRDHDKKFKQYTIEYEQHKNEYDQKKNKAIKKYEEEHRAKKMKEEKIEHLKQKIERQTAKSKTLVNQVTRMRKYEDFLEHVREKNSDDFTDIFDILKRFSTLDQSFQDLSERRQHYDREINNLKRERDLYEKQKNDEQLALNIEIAKLQKKLEDFQNKQTNLESEIEDAKSRATEKDMELGRMLTAIENLYEQCKSEEYKIRHDRDIEKGQKTPDPNDFKKRADHAKLKLSAIKKYIIDLVDIIEDPVSQEILKRVGKSSKLRPTNIND